MLTRTNADVAGQSLSPAFRFEGTGRWVRFKGSKISRCAFRVYRAHPPLILAAHYKPCPNRFRPSRAARLVGSKSASGNPIRPPRLHLAGEKSDHFDYGPDNRCGCVDVAHQVL
jgi:hypothetical protein